MTSSEMSSIAPARTLSLPFESWQIVLRLAACVLIGAMLTTLTDSFFTWNNILNVLRQASLLFFMSFGLTFVLIAGKIDLSLGSCVGLCACVAGTCIHATGNPWLGAAVALAIGSFIGLLNGVMVAKMRIPSFIATYGMLWVLQGLTYYYMGGETVHGFPAGFRQLGSGHIAGVPIPVWIMLLFLAAGGLFARHTNYGQQIYALGANPVAARLSGVPVNRRLILVFVVSGAMAGLASLIFLARLNSAEGDIGETLILPAVAAVLIGGTSLFGGVGSITGTFIGALILTLALNGMNLLSVNANWQPLVTGAIILFAAWADFLTRQKD